MPLTALAQALGADDPAAVAALVPPVAAAYLPGSGDGGPAADAAADELLDRLGAARAAVLVQSCLPVTAWVRAALDRGVTLDEVLISIRDDMLSRLDLFKALVPNLLSNYLRLDHLDRRAAREAIVRPLERYNGLVSEEERTTAEPELVEAVLDGSGSEGHIEAPYLQLVMQRLWDEELREGSRRLRMATLQRLGGPREIVLGTPRRRPGDTRRRPGSRRRAVQPTGHAVGHEDRTGLHGSGGIYAAARVTEVEPVTRGAFGREFRILRPVTAGGIPEGRGTRSSTTSPSPSSPGVLGMRPTGRWNGPAGKRNGDTAGSWWSRSSP